jgi:hypothetical protein
VQEAFHGRGHVREPEPFARAPASLDKRSQTTTVHEGDRGQVKDDIPNPSRRHDKQLAQLTDSRDVDIAAEAHDETAVWVLGAADRELEGPGFARCGSADSG